MCVYPLDMMQLLRFAWASQDARKLQRLQTRLVWILAAALRLSDDLEG